MRNIVFAFSLCLLSAQAQDYTYTTNNGAITITGYYGPSGSVTIPDTINGLPVISIGNYAFYLRGHIGIYISSITVPSSVTSVGYYALAENYPNLTGVYFMGAAPTYVGECAFFGTTFGNPNPCNTVVYYFPGATVWGPTLGGRPTALWNPRIANCRVEIMPEPPKPCFMFTITGNTNMAVVVEESADMSVWSRQQTITIPDHPVEFVDPQWTNYPARFYRLRWP